MDLPTPFDPNHQRYTQRPFPPYPYIQGHAPHPHLDPKGHSYGKKEAIGAVDEGFHYGVDLYNFNYWWEAHEAWENVWKQTQRTDRPGLFLQGLIQISAGMIKWWIQNSQGMEQLFQEGIAKLHPLVSEPPMMGLDLKAHLPKVRRFLTTRKKADYPFIVLR